MSVPAVGVREPPVRDRSGEQASQPPSSRQIDLEVRVRNDCEAKFYSDGDLAWEGTLHAGEVHQITAGSKIALWVSNAGAVSVSFNGEPQPPLGPKGEPVEATFRAAK